MPHQFNAARFQKSARQKHRVTRWAAYNDSLRAAYGLPLRQIQGLMRNVAGLMGLDVPTPSFSALPRRSKGFFLPAAKHRCVHQKPVDLDVVIPPPKNAVTSLDAARHPTGRDREIAQRGRMAWQKSIGYNQRSRIETQIGRWKTVVGQKLQAPTFDNQKTEARVGVRALNRMTGFGHPIFERIA